MSHQVIARLAKLLARIFLRTIQAALLVLLAMFAVLGLGTSFDAPREDVTHVKPFSEMVDARYRVIGDEIKAYGIHDYPGKEKILFVDIIPGVGIGGPEVAYKIPVPVGAIVTIQKVTRVYTLFERVIEYTVAVTDKRLPINVEFRLDLMRGNEGEGLSLNSKLYERIK